MYGTFCTLLLLSSSFEQKSTFYIIGNTALLLSPKTNTKLCKHLMIPKHYKFDTVFHENAEQ